MTLVDHKNNTIRSQSIDYHILQLLLLFITILLIMLVLNLYLKYYVGMSKVLLKEF